MQRLRGPGETQGCWHLWVLALRKPSGPESAFGSAILAASKTAYANLSQACRAMVSVKEEVEPDATKAQAYSDHYSTFREEFKKRGYD